MQREEFGTIGQHGKRLDTWSARSFSTTFAPPIGSLADETTAALFKAVDIGAPGVPNRRDSNGVWPRDVLAGCAEQGATQPTPHGPPPGDFKQWPMLFGLPIRYSRF
jgi:hypothetical protein